jgi:hypothetical protein
MILSLIAAQPNWLETTAASKPNSTLRKLAVAQKSIIAADPYFGRW